MFELEIHHTTEIDGIPVERLDAMTAEWLAFPKWKRVLRRPPLLRIGKKLTVEPESVDGTYDTLEAAQAAARQQAHALHGTIRPDSAIVVIRTSDNEIVASHYPTQS